MHAIETALKCFPLYNGAMLGASKSAYADLHKNDLVIFNANICTKEFGKVWWGDLNVTKSQKHLHKLADDAGVDIYVLNEMDARFQFEAAPQLHKAMVVFQPGTKEVRISAHVRQDYT